MKVGTPNGPRNVANGMSIDHKRMRYDQIRIMASPDGMFVKDALGNNMSVHGFNISAHSGREPQIVLTLAGGKSNNFDVAGKPIFGMIDPETNQPRLVRKIVWADGAETEFPQPPGMSDVKFVREDAPPSAGERQAEAAPAAEPAPAEPKPEGDL